MLCFVCTYALGFSDSLWQFSDYFFQQNLLLVWNCALDSTMSVRDQFCSSRSAFV